MRLLLSFLLMVSVAVAHGGTYTGPVGGGGLTHGGAVGGGTTGVPNPGRPNPGGGGGVTGFPAPTGGVTPTPGGVPVRPGVGGVPRPGGRGFGGVTRRRGKAKNPFLNWTHWWDLNDDRYLLLKKKVRSLASASSNRDTFLDGLVDDEAVGVTQKVIRTDILPAITFALKDTYYDTRAAAAIALGKVAFKDDDDALRRISELFKDKSRQVREAACLGIGLLDHRRSFSTLKKIYEDKQKLLRTRCFALVGMGLSLRNTFNLDQHFYLCNVVKDKSQVRDLRVAAATGLQVGSNTNGAPALNEVFLDVSDDPYVRAHVGVTLGKMKAAFASAGLSKTLESKDTHVSRTSAIALGMITYDRDKDIVNKLRRMAISGANRGTKNFSIISLGEIGSPRGMNSLLERFIKGTEMDKSFAALAIGIYGFNKNFKIAREKEYVSDLIHKEYIKVKSPSLKGSFAIALGLLNYSKSADDIRKDIEKVGSHVTQGHLSMALALMDDKASIPAIQELVKKRGDPDRRRLASMALGMLGDPEAVDLLQQVIKESSSSKSILAAATVSLGHIGDRSAVKTLVDIAMLNSSDISRAFAVVALGYLGDKEDIPALSTIHYNSNYLATTEMLAELLTIL